MSKDKLELEAMDLLRAKWQHLYTFGYPKRPFPINYEYDLSNVILGLTSKCAEAEKLRFAIEQLKALTEKIGGYSFDDINNLLSKLEQQLKTIKNE